MKQLDGGKTLDRVEAISSDTRNPDRLITADEVAAMISISPKSIYRWASEGRLPSFREGRVIRFLASDVEAFIKSRIGAGARGMD